MKQSDQHCRDGIDGYVKRIDFRLILCCKWKSHYLELDIKYNVLLRNSWWAEQTSGKDWWFSLFLNSLYHKRYQEQDAENILHCLIFPLYPGRVGACIKSTFHRLICLCAFNGSWVLLSYMVSSSVTCCLVESTEGEWFHFQTENALCLFLFVFSPPPPQKKIASFGGLLQLLLCFIISLQVCKAT